MTTILNSSDAQYMFFPFNYLICFVGLRPCSVILDSFQDGNNMYSKKLLIGTTRDRDLFRPGTNCNKIDSDRYNKRPEINP